MIERSRSPTRPDPRAQSPESDAGEALAACLVKIENFTRDRVEAACREHPDRADTIRERMKAVRFAGITARVDRSAHIEWSGTKSTSWEDAPTFAANEAFEPIGPYQPLSVLGRGGQALVYLAEDLRLHRPVALKILNGFSSLSEDVMRRFRREAEVASRLDHPGICAVFDAGVERGIPYIAMRYVDGQPLAAIIAAARDHRAHGGPHSFVELPSGEPAEPDASDTRRELMRIVRLIERAARALHAAHEAGIVHRDVKPANIMVTPTAEPVWLDFGLAAEVAGELSALTRTGELLGTPAYMSPEQLLAKRIRLDRRTDVYSLGATLYECVALRRPFEGPTREAVFHAIQFEDPPSSRKLNPRVPADLAIVIEKALEKNPDRRYSTAAALADDLRRVRTGETITARPTGRAIRTFRWAKRRPFRAAVVLTLLLGLPLVTGLSAYTITKLPEYQDARELQDHETLERLLEAGFSAFALHDDAAYENAIEWFDRALDEDPDCVEAVAGKVLTLYSQREYEESERVLDRNRRLEDEQPALQRVRVHVLSKLGREAEAARLARSIPAPQNELDQFVAGLRHMSDCSKQTDVGVFRHAADHLSRAVLVSQRRRPMYLFELAHAIGHLHDAKDAEMISRVLQTSCPDSSAAWWRVGTVWRRVDPDRAIAAYRKALELEPGDLDSSRNLARMLVNRNEFDDAIAVLDRAIELNEEAGALHVGRGLALAATGRKEEARAACERALALRPKQSGTYTNLGTAFFQLGDDDRAIALFRKAIELNPHDAVPVGNLGMALMRRGKLDEAIAACRRAIELDPSRPECRGKLTQALVAKGDVDGAIAAAREAVEALPDAAAAHHAFGCLLHNRRGRFDEAIVCFKRAIALDPAIALFHSNLAQALLSRGDHDLAIRACRKAIELDQNHAPAWSLLSSALVATGRFEEAIVALERTRELQGDAFRQHNNFGLALTRVFRLEDAVKQYEKAIEKDWFPALAYARLVTIYLDLGRFESAENAWTNSVRLLKDVHPPPGDGRRAADDRQVSDGNVALSRSELATASVEIARAYGDRGDRRRQLKAYRVAASLNPNAPGICSNLSGCLTNQGLYDQAEHGYRRAIRLFHARPASARNEEYVPWANLAALSQDLGRSEEARRLHQHVLTLLPSRRVPRSGAGFVNYGGLLQSVGDFASALDIVRKAHALGADLVSSEPWCLQTAEIVRVAERLVELRGRVDAVLRGDETPDLAEDWALLAVILRAREEHASATRFFAEAFARDPALAVSIKDMRYYRVDAARSAVLAGSGREAPETALTLTERATLRQRALSWLDEECTYLAEDVISASEAVRSTQPDRYDVMSELRRWQLHVDFAGVRGVEGLTHLPAAERAAWIGFWCKVEAVVDAFDDQ